jgi:HlyD family secretion protein
MSPLSPPEQVVRRSLTRHLTAIGITALLLVVGLGGWAATTEFSGAVIAQGYVVVSSYVKKVQHPNGGIVGALHVHEGDTVDAGQILVQLDETQTRANLAIITKALDELGARQAREEAERDSLAAVAFPSDLLSRKDQPDVAKAIEGELRQFQTRRAAREGQRSQFKERTVQLRQETVGYEAQIASKDKQVEWITKELAGVSDLWKKNLIPYSRVSALERERERLEGERGQLVASIAQAKGKMAETELQILQIDQEMRAEVSKDLAEIRGRTAELVEKRVAADDLLKRTDIRSPIEGFVHQLAVHTIGGVIAPGEVIMLIVPKADALEIEGRLQPQDIDQVHVAQKAILRFSAFSQRTTPELNGEVSQVSADTSEDPKTGARFYTIRISVPQSELERLGHKLLPGMPAEAFIQTSPRTVISYLVKPLHDQIMRAFRER